MYLPVIPNLDRLLELEFQVFCNHTNSDSNECEFHFVRQRNKHFFPIIDWPFGFCYAHYRKYSNSSLLIIIDDSVNEKKGRLKLFQDKNNEI